MSVGEHKKSVGKTRVRAEEYVLRSLKFFFMGFGGLGAFGNMGRSLIEGVAWWVSLVDLYSTLMSPVAELLETVLQAPFVLISLLFDVAPILPAFSAWGMDIIVLANVAAGFLVFKKFLSLQVQTFLSLTMVFALIVFVYAIGLFAAGQIIAAGILGVLGAILIWRSYRAQCTMVADATSAKAWNGHYRMRPRPFEAALKEWAPVLADPKVMRGVGGEMLYPLFLVKTRLAAYQIVTTNIVILLFATMILLMNSYADPLLPFWQRLSVAFGAMLSETFLKPFGLG